MTREPIKVAIVDDQELFRRGLVLLLSGEDDLEVIGEASNGPEAVRLCETSPPDVVLLDILMPKGSGLDACSEIKEVAPSAAIIMLTASDDETDLYTAIKNGATGYLLKSSSIGEVAQAVRGVAAGQSLISPGMATKLLEEFKSMVTRGDEGASTPKLTDRESEVLSLVARGLHNRDVARQLFISEYTVKNHVRNILDKLQLKTRIDAVLYAVRQHLVDDR